MGCYFLFAILVTLFVTIVAHQEDERIVASSISQHSGGRTTWSDLPVGIMPRFGINDEVVFHAHIPKLSKNASDHRIDISSDFKVSFAFDSHKLVVPWITVFDANKKRTLRKLFVTFTKDEHEIVKVDHELECKYCCYSISSTAFSYKHMTGIFTSL